MRSFARKSVWRDALLRVRADDREVVPPGDGVVPAIAFPEGVWERGK
jgi:hypothetical protein